MGKRTSTPSTGRNQESVLWWRWAEPGPALKNQWRTLLITLPPPLSTLTLLFIPNRNMNRFSNPFTKTHMKQLANTFGLALVIVIVMTSIFLMASSQYSLAAEPTPEQTLQADKLEVQAVLDATLTAKQDNDSEIIDLEYDLETKHVLAEEIDAKIRRLRREVRKMDNKLGIINVETVPLTEGSND